MFKTLGSMMRRRFRAPKQFGLKNASRTDLQVPTLKARLLSPTYVAKTSGEQSPVTIFVFFCGIPFRIKCVIPVRAAPTRRYVFAPVPDHPHPCRPLPPRHLPSHHSVPILTMPHPPTAVKRKNVPRQRLESTAEISGATAQQRHPLLAYWLSDSLHHLGGRQQH